MNLVSVLESGMHLPPPVPGWEEGQKSVLIPVAFCSESSCTVLCRAHLIPCPDLEPGCWEFVFDIYVQWMDGSQEALKTMDRTMAAPYIPDDVRGLIMPLVCTALEMLVETCRPETVFRVTKGRNLPDKALIKHYMLSNTLEQLGFSAVENGTDRADRTYSLMSLHP